MNILMKRGLKNRLTSSERIELRESDRYKYDSDPARRPRRDSDLYKDWQDPLRDPIDWR